MLRLTFLGTGTSQVCVISAIFIFSILKRLEKATADC